MKLYLGGAITYYYLNGQLRKAIDWRNRCVRNILELNREIGENKFTIFNPVTNFKENLQYSKSTVVHQNIHYLDQCHLMVVNVDKLEFSPGTMFEMFYYYLKQKPVIAFGESNFTFQPHIANSITEHLIDLDEVIKYLKNMYAQ